MEHLSKIEFKILSRLAKQNDLEDRDFFALYQEYLPLLIDKNLINRTTIVIHSIKGRENERSGYRITPEGRNALEFSRIEKRNNVINCICKFLTQLIKLLIYNITRFF